MKERISKLLTIKSLVTLVLTVVFAYLAITGTINAEQFMLVFTTVIAFYFGTQTEKNAQAAVQEGEILTESVVCPYAEEGGVDNAPESV